MVKKVETAIVRIWGESVGAVSWLDDQAVGVFEFDPDFLKKGIDLSPVHMGIDKAGRGDTIFSFPALSKETYLGLPGMLADALPDKFGNRIIDAWLARNSRNVGSFSPIERLCYTGKRGMGALEFHPPVTQKFEKALPLEVARLVELTQEIITDRSKLNANLGENEKENKETIQEILRVGTSAGGARAKAIIAMDQAGHILSGQSDVPTGYDYWILKFDGVEDLELGSPVSFGRIEYAYYLMAVAAGIEMTECRLLEENRRAHFLTKRFDRQDGRKIHLQSLCGLAHYDYNVAGAYSYEQAFEIMRKLRLSKAEALQQFRRMVFNVIARNQDDHTKNIAFLMDHTGRWKLSPAFDIIYAHNPAGKWTNQHQMTINGKRDGFTKRDLVSVGDLISLPRPEKVVAEIIDVVYQWPLFAKKAMLDGNLSKQIQKHHRLKLEG